MKSLAIIGAGGHGMVAAEIAQLMGNWREIVFLDKKEDIKDRIGFPVIGVCEEWEKLDPEKWDFFVAFGDSGLRLRLIEKLNHRGVTLPILIHPCSTISRFCKLGQGSIVMAGCVVNCQVYVGKGCILNTGCSIDHECILEDGVHISPGAHVGGVVRIGKYTWICIGASISHDITIGAGVVIAAGAVVIDNIPDNVMAAGVPASVKKRLADAEDGESGKAVQIADKTLKENKRSIHGAKDFPRSIQILLKRMFDIVFAVFGLMILWPVMACAALYVRIKSPGPVIFKQTRTGYKGKPFIIYKFRTLTNDRDLYGNLLPAAERIKPWGLILRKTDFDELPQLINVLKGEMSLVGPRPLFDHYMRLYTPAQMKRHDMKPGITGLTQVGRSSSLTWKQRFDNDLYYVENWSLWLDFKILFRTFLKMFKKKEEGIHEFFTEYTGTLGGENAKEGLYENTGCSSSPR
ncbi:MAG: NeuD/PglB/VioB family sugar acetyltransferase [Clostridia bacterium]|nr:NeuD/PglB/VioB family sugar acetyltransferase [Clostridia bacterium]